MTLKESFDYQKAERKRPANTVVAAEEPMVLGQILLLGERRFRVAEVLDQGEFQRRLRQNMAHPKCAAGTASLDGARLPLLLCHGTP